MNGKAMPRLPGTVLSPHRVGPTACHPSYRTSGTGAWLGRIQTSGWEYAQPANRGKTQGTTTESTWQRW